MNTKVKFGVRTASVMTSALVVITALGAAGCEGDQGDVREVGLQGEKGDPGERGLTGAQGPAGEQGLRGEIGPTGATGEPGQQGKPGEAGPQGEKGDTGPKGAQGDQGPTGFNGAPGVAGPPGAQGPEGREGPPGSFPGTMSTRTGNNGTVSCATYCSNIDEAWGITSGSCVAARLDINETSTISSRKGKFLGCNDVPAATFEGAWNVMLDQVTCWCFSLD